jgi:putative tricarboxylic transport membrane protein
MHLARVINPMRFLTTLVLLAAVPLSASAQAWKPTKEVEFVIPFAVGGGADLTARAIHKVITDEKLVPVPVALVNKPGGGGATGIGYVTASRKADPNTLVMLNGSAQITPILTPAARTLVEVQPLMNVMLDDFMFFVLADAPWKTAAEFIKDAKAKPPKTYSFSAGGTVDVMAVTVFGRSTGTELNPIVFNSGGEALTALLGSHVTASIGNPLEFMGHLQRGTVRAIGVFRDTRFAILPNVPTMKEQGINAPNVYNWRGVGIPKGAPAEAAEYWQGVMAKVVASPQFKAYLKDNAASEAPIAGADFEKFLAVQERFYRDLLGK